MAEIQDGDAARQIAAPRSLKMNEPEIAALFENILPDDFTEKEAALIKFARKANRNWHGINGADHKALVNLEVEEAEMLEAMEAMELFIAFNRFADVMDVEIDF